ncbi:RNA-guided endonuclease InsQ/TnpB family protein [Cellulomonas marina]|uniref:Putative transposase n=1 Tax=Cellulomonas marina TaxID=988821 RepID=A0A1I1ASC2_9CELL|nr:RNA-guided endonuclease TnpB family protein [Cellulomonas marina]GIG29268.1 hypothetical protein Cma02nite_18680 [Cellulomonas marina]SFB40412.1 putative transposase [Cellulomonas marina]
MGEQTTTRVVRLCLDTRALSEEQAVLLARHAGTARAVWNWALAAVNAHEDAVRAHVQNQAAGAAASSTALMDDSAWRRRAYAAARAELGRTPRAIALGRAFTAETRDPESRFAWWQTERHGVNRFAVSSALRALDASVDRYHQRLTAPARRTRRDGRPAGWPRFKRKGRDRDAFSLYNLVIADQDPWRVIDGAHRIKVPSLGSLRVHENTRQLRRLIHRGGRPTAAHFSRHGDRWYVSINVAIATTSLPAPVTTRAQRTAGVVGVDLGVKHLAVLSDGTVHDNPRAAAAAERRLTRAQRAAARRAGPRRGVGPSEGWKEAQRAVARLRHRTALRRQGVVHELTKALATGWAVVAIEDLNVRGMTAAPLAVPDPDRPGSFLSNGSAAKSGLNRAILDVGFGELRRQLTYKAERYGSVVVAVARFAPTSKTCSGCGAVRAKLLLSERTYRCDECGLVIDRDLNAARNIRDLASAIVATSPADAGDAKRPDERRRPRATGEQAGPARPRTAGPPERVTDSPSPQRTAPSLVA